MEDFPAQRVRAFVVWEPVLSTDWATPSTATLKRIPDLRAFQLWDKNRMLSKLMGEHDRQSIVWDYIAVYPAGAVWKEHPPEALYHGGPVVRVAAPARAALDRALHGIKTSD